MMKNSNKKERLVIQILVILHRTSPMNLHSKIEKHVFRTLTWEVQGLLA